MLIDHIRAEIAKLEEQRTNIEHEGKDIIERCTAARFMDFSLQETISKAYSHKLSRINEQLVLLRTNLTKLEAEKQ